MSVSGVERRPWAAERSTLGFSVETPSGVVPIPRAFAGNLRPLRTGLTLRADSDGRKGTEPCGHYSQAPTRWICQRLCAPGATCCCSEEVNSCPTASVFRVARSCFRSCGERRRSGKWPMPPWRQHMPSQRLESTATRPKPRGRTCGAFEESMDPTVVCAWCAKTLVRGGRDISHGLCEGCLPAFVAAARGVTEQTPKSRSSLLN